jgi:hypothetical protein
MASNNCKRCKKNHSTSIEPRETVQKINLINPMINAMKQYINKEINNQFGDSVFFTCKTCGLFAGICEKSLNGIQTLRWYPSHTCNCTEHMKEVHNIVARKIFERQPNDEEDNKLTDSLRLKRKVYGEYLNNTMKLSFDDPQDSDVLKEMYGLINKFEKKRNKLRENTMVAISDTQYIKYYQLNALEYPQYFQYLRSFNT